MKSKKQLFYEHDSTELIWKHPQTDVYPNTRVMSQEGFDILFYQEGTLASVFNDQKHAHIIHAARMKRKPLKNCGIYYVNRQNSDTLRWGTQHRVEVYDKTFDINTSLGAHGVFRLKITQPLKLFSKLPDTVSNPSNESIERFVNDQLTPSLRFVLSKYYSMYLEGLQNMQEAHSLEAEMAIKVKDKTNEVLSTFGLSITDFTFKKIDFDQKLLQKLRASKEDAMFGNNEAKLVCPQCKTRNHAAARYCKQCGHALIHRVLCPKCKKLTNHDGQYCIHCGGVIMDETIEKK